MDFTFIDEAGAGTVFSPEQAACRIGAISAHLAAAMRRDAAVGLMFRTGAELVTNWIACLHAGLRPLVMQYPTHKQSHAYWAESVANTVRITGLDAILADEHCVTLGLPGLATTLSGAALRHLADGEPCFGLPADFTILQLSSGTTGHRKAMAFSAAALRRHVADFNRSLALTKQDRIVSWLPLYHDMGYVACFVMPLLLGTCVVMIDPGDWVRRPAMLWDAIERHAGTICYMPNFGFEVMARTPARLLPGMRRWISCSEPISADTVRRFLVHTGTAEAIFSACYAMAENIFAISLRTGLASRAIGHGGVVSCGRPIAGVDVKEVAGELWVRSPASLAHYLDGADIRDADGFYPTGDLGAILDGEIYVTGRKQDLLIQAGRKHFLSDIDLLVNRLLPEAAGRAAALALQYPGLGTETPVVLIESADFYARQDQATLADAVIQAGGPEPLEIVFVPPRFLTKTSSGKINRRKSAGDYLAVRQARLAGNPATIRDPAAELRAAFKYMNWHAPVGDTLDSLSLTVLRLVLSEARVAYHASATLAELHARLAGGHAGGQAVQTEAAASLRIVNLADRSLIAGTSEAQLRRFAERVGLPVTIDHLCLPPIPVLLSDLVFEEYFAPRLDQAPLAAVHAALAKLRAASLIVVDDVAEMRIGSMQVYAPLSYNLERAPGADLISFRWQPYALAHDRLPVTVASGPDLPLDARTATIDRLAAYLKTPIFRVARDPVYEPFTRDWDWHTFDNKGPGVDKAALLGALADWIAGLAAPLATPPRRPGPGIDLTEPGHYCSAAMRQGPIDELLERFTSFCLVGAPASLPYIRKRLDALAKRYFQVPSFAPAVLAELPESFDCMLICGPMGNDPIEVPAVAFQHIGPDHHVSFNLDWFAARYKMVWEHPATREDWFFHFPLLRHKNRAQLRGKIAQPPGNLQP